MMIVYIDGKPMERPVDYVEVGTGVVPVLRDDEMIMRMINGDVHIVRIK